MKAVTYAAPGPPDVLQLTTVPTPEPGPGLVRVKVAYAAVNPIDVYIRSGMVAMAVAEPRIPGCDFAGTVDAVGGGVSRFKVGDRVWGSNQGLNGRPGTFAEFVCPAEEWVYALPANVEFKAAAAAALTGITAHLGLFYRTNLRSGETVFVNGGAGGVGAMVVQMATAVGARVIATAGTDEKVAAAKNLGAAAAVNYATGDVAAAVKEFTGGKGVDVWFETQPPTDLERTVELTAARGRIVVMAGRAAKPMFPNGAFYVKGLQLNGFAMFNFSAAEQRAAAEDMNQWLANGKLKPLIGAEFELKDAAAAHRLQEDNTLRKAGTLSGKIVIRVA